jgi:hypothetical protein
MNFETKLINSLRLHVICRVHPLQSREQSLPPASQEDDEDGTEVRVEPKESAGSCWLETHVFNNLGIHLKFGLCCNQRCQFQLVFAFLVLNSLVMGLFLDLFS